MVHGVVSPRLHVGKIQNQSSLVIPCLQSTELLIRIQQEETGSIVRPAPVHHELSTPTPLRQQFHLQPSQWLHDGPPAARSAAAKPRGVSGARGEAPPRQPDAACGRGVRVLLLHLQRREADDGRGGGHAVGGGGPCRRVRQQQDPPGHRRPADRLVRLVHGQTSAGVLGSITTPQPVPLPPSKSPDPHVQPMLAALYCHYVLCSPTFQWISLVCRVLQKATFNIPLPVQYRWCIMTGNIENWGDVVKWRGSNGAREVNS